ncbi:dihydrodipicolinate synthase family protein [Paenibacillus sp. GCM10027626]|uniref:dihydrodipicolinate synthase family protein n=1 Tax=Paenibacillus sp. GCM10027626 TaxID=3273411 RepID=UPI00363B8AF0
MAHEDYKGIYPALLTPMLEDGSIDERSLQRHVERLLSQGVHGFYVGGSTGEAFMLDREERMRILETVIRANDGKGKIIAHVGSIGTRETIKLARHAEEAGADMLSAVVPFYYKAGMKEIRDHYLTIMTATKLPMLIYHFPGATGVSLSMDFYEEMAKEEQCIGVKFTSLNLFEMQQIRARCGKDFLIFNGHDEVYAAGALMGADGAIGSTFNMMPGLFVEMFRCASSGQWEKLPKLQEQANEIIADLVRYDVIAYEKYVAHLQGSLAHPTARQPLPQLTAQQQEEIRRFFAGNSLLKL